MSRTSPSFGQNAAAVRVDWISRVQDLVFVAEPGGVEESRGEGEAREGEKEVRGPHACLFDSLLGTDEGRQVLRA